jgi:hypothetical protein
MFATSPRSQFGLVPAYVIVIILIGICAPTGCRRCSNLGPAVFFPTSSENRWGVWCCGLLLIPTPTLVVEIRTLALVVLYVRIVSNGAFQIASHATEQVSQVEYCGGVVTIIWTKVCRKAFFYYVERAK